MIYTDLKTYRSMITLATFALNASRPDLALSSRRNNKEDSLEPDSSGEEKLHDVQRRGDL